MTDTNIAAAPLPKCPGIIRGQRYSTDHAAVTIDGQRLNWQESLAVGHHSSTGINWGSPGSGSSQLALALLLEVTDRETARHYSMRFRDGVIVHITTDSWATTTADLVKWLEQSRATRHTVRMDVDPDDTGPRRTVAWAWGRDETRRRHHHETTTPVLAPAESFRDEYLTIYELGRIDPDADPVATGPHSQTIRGLLCGACAGWEKPPTSLELYEAMAAMRTGDPTSTNPPPHPRRAHHEPATGKTCDDLTSPAPRNYPDATWSTSLSPGWTRYETWLAHERKVERQMLRFLHEYCPETLWAYVDPDLAQDLHTVHSSTRSLRPPSGQRPPAPPPEPTGTRRQGRAPRPAGAAARPRRAEGHAPLSTCGIISARRGIDRTPWRPSP